MEQVRRIRWGGYANFFAGRWVGREGIPWGKYMKIEVFIFGA